ncbi:MAG TPA: tryptophan synthase subunit beta, partial [Thermodesulfovibrionia bacterium]|nr:tryptophan synthase subunit beta [Thermodesulfovibrionia bacterium]
MKQINIGPDKQGHFAEYGGRFVPETLMPALIELEEAFYALRQDREFQQELAMYRKD